jgi:hypothetical protein
MTLDWSAVVSALIGTTIPGLAVYLFLLWLSGRNSRSLESHRNELTKGSAEVQHLLAKRGAQAKLWHERRVEALIEIYGAFVSYLRFLRRVLYVNDGRRNSMDPYFEFRETLDKNHLFLDDELREFIDRLSGELLLFWNWAIAQKRQPSITEDEVQRRLDFEIPQVLERRRVRVNQYADPDYHSPEPEGPNKRSQGSLNSGVAAVSAP